MTVEDINPYSCTITLSNNPDAGTLHLVAQHVFFGKWVTPPRAVLKPGESETFVISSMNQDGSEGEVSYKVDGSDLYHTLRFKCNPRSANQPGTVVNTLIMDPQNSFDASYNNVGAPFVAKVTAIKPFE